MTLKELSQLYHINNEIAADKSRLAELRASLPGDRCINYDDMPKIKNSRSNTIEVYVAKIIELENRIAEKMLKQAVEYERLENYINSINYSLTRQIFIHRFMKYKTWYEVSLAIGGYNTEDSVKKRVYRYLKKESAAPVRHSGKG